MSKKSLEEASLEELVEALGPRIRRDVGSHGEYTMEMIAQMGILAEIEKRGKRKEAAKIALEKWPELEEDLDPEVKEGLEL